MQYEDAVEKCLHLLSPLPPPPSFDIRYFADMHSLLSDDLPVLSSIITRPL